MDFHLETDAEWLAFAKDKDEKGSATARTLAEALKVTIKEDKIGGVCVYWVTQHEIDEDHQRHLFVSIYGGGYFLNAGMAGNIEAVLIASRMKIPVVSIDYRMPPKDPAPAATDDVIAV